MSKSIAAEKMCLSLVLPLPVSTAKELISAKYLTSDKTKLAAYQKISDRIEAIYLAALNDEPGRLAHPPSDAASDGD